MKKARRIFTRLLHRASLFHTIQRNHKMAVFKGFSRPRFTNSQLTNRVLDKVFTKQNTYQMQMHVFFPVPCAILPSGNWGKIFVFNLIWLFLITLGTWRSENPDDPKTLWSWEYQALEIQNSGNVVFLQHKTLGT